MRVCLRVCACLLFVHVLVFVLSNACVYICELVHVYCLCSCLFWTIPIDMCVSVRMCLEARGGCCAEVVDEFTMQSHKLQRDPMDRSGRVVLRSVAESESDSRDLRKERKSWQHRVRSDLEEVAPRPDPGRCVLFLLCTALCPLSVAPSLLPTHTLTDCLTHIPSSPWAWHSFAARVEKRRAKAGPSRDLSPEVDERTLMGGSEEAYLQKRYSSFCVFFLCFFTFLCLSCNNPSPGNPIPLAFSTAHVVASFVVFLHPRSSPKQGTPHPAASTGQGRGSVTPST